MSRSRRTSNPATRADPEAGSARAQEDRDRGHRQAGHTPSSDRSRTTQHPAGQCRATQCRATQCRATRRCRALGARRPGAGVVLGQDQVQRAAGLRQDGARLGQLVGRARTVHLHHRHHDLPDEVVELDGGLVGHPGGGVPGGAQLLRVLLRVGSARVGQRVHAAAALALGGDQPLVLKLLQRRVHRPRARPPHAARPARDLLDQLVAVPLPALGEQVEDRGPHVALADPAAAAAAAAESHAG